MKGRNELLGKFDARRVRNTYDGKWTFLWEYCLENIEIEEKHRHDTYTSTFVLDLSSIQRVIDELSTSYRAVFTSVYRAFTEYSSAILFCDLYTVLASQRHIYLFI